MEARLEESVLERVEHNSRNITYIERSDTVTRIVRPGGTITIEFVDNIVYFTSYGKKGEITYETSREDNSGYSPRTILASEEMGFIERIKYWEDIASKLGINTVKDYLMRNFQKKVQEQKIRQINSRAALEAQKIVDNLSEIEIKS